MKTVQHACRRVSNAHVRSQLPWNDENRSSDDDQQEPDDGREVRLAPVAECTLRS